MRRREFIAASAASAFVWPLAAHPQKVVNKVPRIGILWGGEKNARAVESYRRAFLEGLRERGYLEGQTVVIEERFAEPYASFDQLAAELLHANVTVLVATSTPTALAAKRATSAVPVVFAYATDPVGLKLVNSLARPGGNVTGLSAMTFDLMPKQIEVLKEAIVGIKKIAILYDTQIPAFQRMLDAYEHAAGLLKLAVQVFSTRLPSDLSSALSGIAQSNPGGLVIAPSLDFYRQRERLAAFGLANHLPTMAWLREMTRAGILMSYGVNELNLYRRAAAYVDRVLKGEHPADLPVEQPTKFDLVINEKTATTLALAIPPTLLAIADGVIN